MKAPTTCRLVPLASAAADLGIQVKELRLEIERSGLPHAKIGERAILVDLELLIQLLAKRASGQPQGGPHAA